MVGTTHPPTRWCRSSRRVPCQRPPSTPPHARRLCHPLGLDSAHVSRTSCRHVIQHLHDIVPEPGTRVPSAPVSVHAYTSQNVERTHFDAGNPQIQRRRRVTVTHNCAGPYLGTKTPLLCHCAHGIYQPLAPITAVSAHSTRTFFIGYS